MAIININVGENDVLNINVVGTNQSSEVNDNKEVIDALYKKLKKDLNEYNSKRYKKEHKCWWYEVFIDFGEQFDDCIYPIIKDMNYQDQFTYCFGYMERCDNYYFSDEHYESLNQMVKELKD